MHGTFAPMGSTVRFAKQYREGELRPAPRPWVGSPARKLRRTWR